jgi:hypothetical protein
VTLRASLGDAESSLGDTRCTAARGLPQLAQAGRLPRRSCVPQPGPMRPALGPASPERARITAVRPGVQLARAPRRSHVPLASTGCSPRPLTSSPVRPPPSTDNRPASLARPTLLEDDGGGGGRLAAAQMSPRPLASTASRRHQFDIDDCEEMLTPLSSLAADVSSALHDSPKPPPAPAGTLDSRRRPSIGRLSSAASRTASSLTRASAVQRRRSWES